MNTEAQDKSVVVVAAADLHGGHSVYCPNPKMTLWSTHPKVFIDVATTGQGRCPYCGTLYKLSGPLPTGH
jgi:uncharacterized Zn-finger protein